MGQIPQLCLLKGGKQILFVAFPRSRDLEKTLELYLKILMRFCGFRIVGQECNRSWFICQALHKDKSVTREWCCDILPQGQWCYTLSGEIRVSLLTVWFWCLTRIQHYFSYIVAVSFIGLRKPEYPEKTTDLSQVTDFIT